MNILEISDQLKNISTFEDIAKQDVLSALLLLDREQHNHFLRRVFIQKVISEVEISNYLQKQLILLLHHMVENMSLEALTESNREIYIAFLEFRLSPEEVVILKESVPSINDQGKIKNRLTFLPLPSYTKFILSLFYRIVNKIEKGKEINFGCKGWEALDKTIKTRNRITHPRSVTDFNVLDHEVEIAKLASTYYQDTVKRLNGALMLKLEEIKTLTKPLF